MTREQPIRPERPLYRTWPRAADLRRSLALDLQLVRIRELPLDLRLGLIRQKIPAALAIVRHRSHQLRLGEAGHFAVSSLSDLGTLEANVADMRDELVATGVLEGAAYVVDIGANIGQWTAAVRLFCPSAEILAVEPDPDVFTRLQANVGAMRGVTCRATAAGAAASSGVLYRHELSLMSSLHPEGRRYDPSDTVEVAVDTIDNLVGPRPVDLLKIDVEGAELDALRGATGTLGRTRFLLVELSLGRRAAGSAMEVLAYVRSCAPEARIIKLGRPLGPPQCPTSQDALIELHPGPRASAAAGG